MKIPRRIITAVKLICRILSSTVDTKWEKASMKTVLTFDIMNHKISYTKNYITLSNCKKSINTVTTSKNVI